MEDFQMLPFSTCRTGAGHIGGGGVIFGGMEEEEGVVEEGGLGGIRQGGGGEQQPPQLVQDRGAAVLLALAYGFMAARLPFDAVGLPSVNSSTKSIHGPLTETRRPPPAVGGRGDQRIRELQLLSPITTSRCRNCAKSCHWLLLCCC